MPKSGDNLTVEQVRQIKNLSIYTDNADNVTIYKNWHQGPNDGGLFEPWAKDAGYPEGFPLYADIKISNQTYHVYWLPTKKIMAIGEKGGVFKGIE
ncbi:MAG: hypothetical protein AAF629_22555 [Chloroflexota bacterium]